MKLVYKNFTICSKAEGSIPVCDTTCVPQLQENLMNSTLQLYLLLDTIYAGYMQVTLQSARTVTIAMRLANIGKNFALLHRQYVYMLLFYVLYRWDIEQVMMEVHAKEQQLQENLVQLGFQRIEYEQEHPAIAKTPLLYRLQKSDFNRTDNQDATELQKLSLEQLWELFPIVIRPYNEQYTAWYDAQRLRLQSLLKASIVRNIPYGKYRGKGIGGEALCGYPAGNGYPPSAEADQNAYTGRLDPDVEKTGGAGGNPMLQQRLHGTWICG